MNKPFSNLINKDKDKKVSSSNKISVKKNNEISKPLVVFGCVISLASIFLLLYTINNKFG